MRRCARCEWQTTSDDLEQARTEQAQHAVDAAHPLCGTCRRSLTDTERSTCQRCVDRARQHLRDVVELYALLPGELGQPRGRRYDGDTRGGGDEHPLPGGDVLVLLAGGSDAHSSDERDSDPPPIAHALGTWALDWQDTRGDSAWVGDVTAAASYLDRHLQWAAVSHPAFGDFSGDVRRHAARLRSATGRSDRPVQAPAACFDCAGELERHWTDTGLADAWTCAQCGETYDHARYFLALRAKIEKESA